ncbi:MAG: alpha/beta fold hydrolase [Candidatus Nanopelagicales bacterium]|nr:alpha/beta fold hydrolase [Candidatus Nanopelagicales bacterium]
MTATPTPDPFAWSTVRVDGNVIRYRVAGPEDAPPMIHVHGFAISGTYLTPTAALLTDSFRVYVPDLPGFGSSPRPVGSLGIPDLASALRGLMDALGIEQAVLVGNSLGCAIILELIDQAPERVSRAVMVGLAGGPHNQPLGKALVQMARDGIKEPPRMLIVAAPDYLRYGPVRAIKLFTRMTQFPAVERFLSMPVPVMAVIGSEDPLRPPWRRITELMAQIPPQVDIVLFQGAAHAINYTHPRELSHAIRQYVAGEPIRMDAGNPRGIPVLQLLRPE